MTPYPHRLALWMTLAACSMNLATIVLWKRYDRLPERRQYSYVGHDYPQTLPLPLGSLDEILMTVEESNHYTLDGKASDAEWASLTPRAGGFLSLGPTNHSRMFLVSMFHQIHCLRFFNWAFDPKFEGLYKAFASKGHNAHCLNYLRQVIMCSADLTLEQGDFAKRNFTIDRVGATHKCRNWRVVYDFLDDNLARREREQAA